jgi:hypothetical protein
VIKHDRTETKNEAGEMRFVEYLSIQKTPELFDLAQFAFLLIAWLFHVSASGSASIKPFRQLIKNEKNWLDVCIRLIFQ